MKTLPLFDTGAPQWGGEGRDPLDRHYTPEWATEELVKYMGARIHGAVWEPCCGADMIGRVLRAQTGINAYLGTDVDPEARSGFWERAAIDGIERWREAKKAPLDFLQWESLPSGITWIISNPPYTIAYSAHANGKATALDFVDKALSFGVGIAMLLRLTWLEPCKERIDFFRNTPPTDVLILRRVNFLNSDVKNMCTSAWVIWDPARRGQQTVRWAI